MYKGRNPRNEQHYDLLAFSPMQMQILSKIGDPLIIQGIGLAPGRLAQILDYRVELLGINPDMSKIRILGSAPTKNTELPGWSVCGSFIFNLPNDQSEMECVIAINTQLSDTRKMALRALGAVPVLLSDYRTRTIVNQGVRVKHFWNPEVLSRTA